MDIDGNRLLARIGADGLRRALQRSLDRDRLVELAGLCGMDATEDAALVAEALTRRVVESVDSAARDLILHTLVAANKEEIDRIHSMSPASLERSAEEIDDAGAGRMLFALGLDDRDASLAAIVRLRVRLAADRGPRLVRGADDADDVESLRHEVRDLRRHLEEVDARLTRATNDIAAEMAGRRQARRPAGVQEQDRVGLFVDVQNMYYAARQLNARLDFGALMAAASRQRRLVRAIAYVVQNRDIDQSGFLTMLQQKRYSVRIKDLKVRHDGSSKGDWDMEIALEILRMAESLDIVALVSGDGDFASLVTQVRSLGPRVEVYSFTGSTAKELILAADRHIPIDESFLLRTPSTS
ncbi:MAG TPA: NYN domain-containing protein [Patescibacteria group bacterium]|nr:NYN domain-containing protein [Patescibacteria group bacterium]